MVEDARALAQFFRLYADRLPLDLFDRLKYIIAAQDWDFTSSSFWLKHGVSLLFDCLHLEDRVLFAYNSAQLSPLDEAAKAPRNPSAQTGDAVPRAPCGILNWHIA